MIEQQIGEQQFDFISNANKGFIVAFIKALENLGYTYNDVIGSGSCRTHMFVFRRADVKSKNVFARIYIREDVIVLRLYFNKVTKHAPYISAAPQHIKSAFVGEYGNCKHCSGDHCKFRKDYEIDGIAMEKCNGETFMFPAPIEEHLADYINLFTEFYPAR